jgi:hypothetical protein
MNRIIAHSCVFFLWIAFTAQGCGTGEGDRDAADTIPDLVSEDFVTETGDMDEDVTADEGCAPGLVLCGDECVDTRTDPDHCGSCENQCRSGYVHTVPVCQNGLCGTACEPGWEDRDDAPGCESACVAAGDEICNGLDDDCDGIPDNFDETAWSMIGALPVSGSGAQYAFQYEASRPTASSCDVGTQQGSGVTVTTKACSRTTVQPWANVDWITAREACCNLNNDNVCHYGGTGLPQRWNLCLEPHWEEICESQGHNYMYPYGDTYFGDYCNGNDHDTNCPCPGPTCPTTTGDQDEILPTGSLGSCCSSWGGQCMFDMSGNVKEWTFTERGTGYRVIRGGSNNSPAFGMTCQFDFTLGSESFAFYNLGFRCCYY